MDRFERIRPLIGQAGIDRLQKAHVLVVGIGGVGSYCVEALARSGVGALTLVDGDTVAASNLNRQIPALLSTIGQKKVRVMAERLRDIDPAIDISAIDRMLAPADLPALFAAPFDFVVDAVDDTKLKIALAAICHERKIASICCLATGNKTDPLRLAVGDLFETKGDPLARRLRSELRKRGIGALPVVWSDEPSIRPDYGDETIHSPASLPFVPPVAGLYLARFAVMKLLECNNDID